MNTHSFEWDTNKAELNLRKHGVTFEETTSVFTDPMFITVVDDEHSIDEERYITIGLFRTRAGVDDSTHRPPGSDTHY